NLGNNLTKIANELDKIFINLPEKSQINMDAVQKYIGISKEYNIFELQRALGERDSKKAYTILNNFSQNIKKNPLVVVIGSLNTYFSKIFMSHFLKNVSEKEFVSTLSLTSEFFIKEYKTAQQRYPLPKVETIISLLKEYDLKSKGINNDGQPDEALMKELVVKILNV
ncbi:MAG: DNA polymerase III subunit delta, partial [Saprospiraceae bacterium]